MEKKIKVLGIYGSPRKGGNSDQLLDKVLEGAQSEDVEISTVYARELNMRGCIECGSCESTGKCVIRDDMTAVYPLLEKADIIFLASPIFFYGLTSQIKALIDRGQAMWSKRMMEKTPDQQKKYDSGKGYLISVGATKGKNLFDGAELIAKYFFDALDMSYEGGIFFKKVEKSADIQKYPEAMDQAFRLGKNSIIDAP